MWKGNNTNKRLHFSLRDLQVETIFAGLKNFLLVNKFLSLSLNEFLQSEIMQKSRSAQYITRIIAVANQVQFVCLFVVLRLIL